MSAAKPTLSATGQEIATWPKQPATKIDGADVTIRRAVEADAQRMFELIEELAVYERAAHEVDINKDHVHDCCFGPDRFCGAFVAEWRDPGKAEAAPVVIGMAIFFFRFHTWKGRQLYLEEFVVSEAYRGGGIGKRLFDRVIEHAKEQQCCGMFWQALDWNEPALNFYRKYKADIDPQWMNCSLHFKKTESAKQE